MYISQTGCTLEHRLKEHKKALTSGTAISAIAEHVLNTNNDIDRANAWLLQWSFGWTSSCLSALCGLKQVQASSVVRILHIVSDISHIWEDYSSLRPVHCVRSSGGLGLAPDELGWVSITLPGYMSPLPVLRTYKL